MATNTDTTARRIVAAITAADRTIAWTADKATIPRPTLYRKLRDDRDFTVREVAMIARALGVAPSSLLPKEFAAVLQEAA